jgi:hypothetical protein
MAKPPKSTPHSDIDGIHQDEELNVKTAAREGQSGASLAHAKKEATARPQYAKDEPGKDDRTG